MLFIRWLLMAILWVYLPKYSTTDFVFPNGFLAKTTQGFFHKSCLICSYFIGSFALSFSQNFALKTFDKAFTGNRNLPLLLLFFHCSSLSTPPPGTMQCKCGCKLYCCPQVCKTAIIPICTSLFLPNCCSVSQVASNKVSYTIFG